MYQWNCSVDIKRSILDDRFRSQCLVKQFPVHSEGISIGHDSSRGFHAETTTWNGYEFAIDRTIANSQFINRQLRTISIYHRAPRIWQRFGHCLRIHNYVVLSKQLRVYDVPYAWETNWFQWELWTNSLQKTHHTDASTACMWHEARWCWCQVRFQGMECDGDLGAVEVWSILPWTSKRIRWQEKLLRWQWRWHPYLMKPRKDGFTAVCGYILYCSKV